MSTNRKFQFRSRVRMSTAQNALQSVSIEPLYSSSDIGDTASELSISVVDVKAPTANDADVEDDNETIVDEDDVFGEKDNATRNVDTTNVPTPKISGIDKEEVFASGQADLSTETTETTKETLTTNLQRSQFFPSATRIVIEEAEPNSPGSLSLSSAHFDETLSEMDALSRNRLSSFTSREDDAQSRLSFIVKERLHEFAKDIRRRTSQVRDEVVREPTPDNSDAETTSAGGGAVGQERQQASLMSLIGLRQTPTDQAEDEDYESSCFGISKSIDPFGQHYMAWLFFVVTALLYNAFMIPLRSSYPYQTDENLTFWLIIDYTCDFIYLIDLVVVKPRLTFMRGGITIKTSSEMMKNYLHSKKFKLDLFSLLPLDIFYFVTGPVSAWRIVRVLKLSCFWEFFDLLDSSFSNPYVIRIAKTFSYMIYIIHCNSCIYYVLSAWQAFGQIPYVYKGKYHLNKWVYNNEGNAYIRCFYFTAAVATSTGNNPSPTNVIEYIYMTFSWMMGVFVFALLLGQIRDIVSNANKNNEEFRTTMDKALGECKRLDLPENLTARVRSWFLYTWEQQKTLDEKKLVEKLPLKLQTDLALSVHYNTLSKVQLFQDADRALLRDLVLKLKPVIFLPNDMICRKGDVGKEMYIVNNGILEVVGGDNNEIVFATLKEGSVFGEISLLAIGGNNRRTANIRSKGYSTLFVLSKEDLNDVIKDYPDAQQLMRRKARQLLQKDVNKRTKGDNNDAGADQAKRDLTEKCRVSSDLRTPRMLAAVAKIMPPHSNTSKILTEALERRHEEDNRRGRRRRFQRWSTMPAELSDISDVENNASQVPASPSFLSKTRSLDT